MNWQPGVTLDQMEKATILQALRFYQNNKKQTAMSLGIALRTLDNKMERYAKEAVALEEKMKSMQAGSRL